MVLLFLFPSRCANVRIGPWRNSKHQRRLALARQQLSVAAELSCPQSKGLLRKLCLLSVVAQLLLMHFSNRFYTSRINLMVFAFFSSKSDGGV